MRLDSRSLSEQIAAMVEVEPWHGQNDFKLLLGVISGNKACLRAISMDKILYLIQNLDEIMERQMESGYPKIKLDGIVQSSYWVRRAI